MGPISVLFVEVERTEPETVEVTKAGVGLAVVKAGRERLKVSSRPPVPKAESGPSVCIAFRVNVGGLVDVVTVGINGCLRDDKSDAEAVAAAAAAAAGAEGLLCKMILGWTEDSCETGRTVMEGAFGAVDGAKDDGRTISIPR